MDVLAVAAAVVGFVLAAHGHAVVGAVLAFGPLVGLAVALGRHRSLMTALPFTFGSHFVVMPLCLIGAGVTQSRSPSVAGAIFSFWPYYYACIVLSERKVRYVPWRGGLGLHWNTAQAADRPLVYWTMVGVCMGIAGLVFALALAHA